MNGLIGFTNLVLKCGFQASTFTMSFDRAILNDINRASITIGPHNFTVQPLNVAVNGLDSGILQGAETWYQVFVVSDGTSAGAVISLNQTAPVLPAGMTHWALAGCAQVLSLGPTKMLGLLQISNRVTTQSYGVLPVPGVAANAANTYQIKNMAREVSPIAKTISGYMGAPTGKDCQMSITADGSVDLGRVNANAVGLATPFDGAGCTVPFNDFALSTPQTLYWKSIDTLQRNILYLTSFTI